MMTKGGRSHRVGSGVCGRWPARVESVPDRVYAREQYREILQGIVLPGSKANRSSLSAFQALCRLGFCIGKGVGGQSERSCGGLGQSNLIGIHQVTHLSVISLVDIHIYIVVLWARSHNRVFRKYGITGASYTGLVACLTFATNPAKSHRLLCHLRLKLSTRSSCELSCFSPLLGRNLPELAA